MKKTYLKIGIVAFAVFGAYSLLACNGQKNESSDSDDQPVDLTAQVATKTEGHSSPITVQSFDETIKGEKLTMVDFYTTWCGPCKMMKPHVLKLASENSDLVNVLQVDAEDLVEISGRYNIRAYPTLMFFKKGQIVKTLEGARMYEDLLAEVKSLQ